MRWLAALLFALASNSGAATYYIDYVGGSDSNNGTATGTPWKAHPYMACRSGGSYTHAAGDRFIFKGGVTWPNACFQMTIGASGTAGNVDYYGVDATYYTGGAWSRPIFDGQHTALTGGTDMLSIGDRAYLQFDNIDLRGHRTFSAANGAATIGYNCPTNVTFSNLWLHDWSVNTGITQDNGQGGIYGNIPGCSPATVWVEYSELSNAEWTGVKQSGGAIRGGNCRFCVIHDVNTGILHGTMHDTLMYNVCYPSGNESFDASFHTNTLYVDEWAGVGVDPGTTPALIYNNYIHHVNTGSGAIYAEPYYSANTTIYIWNNVVHNVGWLGAVNIDTEGLGNVGKVYIWNNTFVVGTDGNGFSGVRNTDRTGSLVALVMQNNHSVNDNGLWGGGDVITLTNNNNTERTVAQAASDGYTSAQTFVYSPPNGSGVTVGAGTNLTAQCGTIALCSDTTYAVTLSSHNVTAPARTSHARPSGGAWDTGAYSYDAALLPAPGNTRWRPKSRKRRRER